LEADGKSPDTRHPKALGMRRTLKYAAVTRDEDNAVDGGFPTASQVIIPRRAAEYTERRLWKESF